MDGTFEKELNTLSLIESRTKGLASPLLSFLLGCLCEFSGTRRFFSVNSFIGVLLGAGGGGDFWEVFQDFLRFLFLLLEVTIVSFYYFLRQYW